MKRSILVVSVVKMTGFTTTNTQITHLEALMNIKFQIFLCILLISPLTAEAQKRIRCESDGGKYNHCNVRLVRGDNVQVSQKHSKAACRRGDSWDLDRSGIWVDKGCRADFLISRDYRRDSYHNSNYSNDRYIERRRRDNYYGGYSDSRGRDNYYNYHQEDDYRKERRRLENERKKLEAERRAFEREKRNQQGFGSCPAGARIGRCSKSERARGCKDWKAADKTPCKSGG